MTRVVTRHLQRRKVMRINRMNEKATRDGSLDQTVSSAQIDS